MERIKVLY